MATVYEALDRRLDRVVAVKIMHPHLTDAGDVVARFRREARAAARLSHPGIVAIYDQGLSGDINYLTMEFVEGENLRTALRRRGSYGLGEALDVVEQVLEALARAHRSDVVHRDVKPENVLIPSDGRIKVADFGLARAVTEATAASTGTVLGTVAYLAPEILTSGQADARADVYATGVMLYELLTGVQPFAEDEPIRVAYQHVHSGIPALSATLSWIPTEVDDLVAAFTARRRDERPADAGAALELLRRVRDALDSEMLARSADVAPAPEEPIAEEPDGTQGIVVGRTISLPIGAVNEAAAGPVRHARRRRRTPLVLLVLTALMLVGSGTAWWFLAGPGAYVEVPELVGLTEDDAVRALETADLYPDVHRDHHDTVPQGEVWRATPDHGSSARRGREVRLDVSLGILMLEMPAVVDELEPDATELIEEAGLSVGTVTSEYDEEVAEGVVLRSDPEAGTLREHNLPVSLVVSAGREPVNLVSVVRSTQEEAIDDLENLDLEVAVQEEYSDTVGQGYVISQSPMPGDEGEVYRGDTVTIVVSLGPELIEVPDVTRGSPADARQELEELGFEVHDEYVLGGILGVVRSTTPAAGSMQPRGTLITLTIV